MSCEMLWRWRSVFLAVLVLLVGAPEARASRGWLPGKAVAGFGLERDGMVQMRLSLQGHGYFFLFDGEPGRWLGVQQPDQQEAGRQLRPFALAFGGPLLGDEPLALGVGLDFEVLSVGLAHPWKGGRQVDVASIGAFVYAQLTGDRGAVTLLGGQQLFGGVDQSRTHLDAYFSLAFDRQGLITPYVSAGYGRYHWEGETCAGFQLTAGLSLLGLLDRLP